MTHMDADDRRTAEEFGIPPEYQERVFAYYLDTYNEEDWWVEPFGDWLRSRWKNWDELKDTFIEGLP